MKIHSSIVMTTVACAGMLPVNKLQAQAPVAASKTDTTEAYAVTAVPAENGSYTISPKPQKDGKVPAVKVLTVQALPHRLTAWALCTIQLKLYLRNNELRELST
jgi:hypothetical protein